MMNLTPKRSALIILIIGLSLGFTSCTGVNSVSDTTWELTRLVSVGDPIENTVTDMIEVKNCGIPIEKTIDCSAGTSNDLSVTLNSGGTFGVGAQFTIDGSVGTTLGIGQQSGQSVKLTNPADGYIYLYTVSKKYQIVAGQAIVNSSNGKEQTVDYIFHSSCSIDIVGREQLICSDTPETFSTEIPNWAFTLEYRFPAGFWAAGMHQYSLEWLCPNEMPDSTTFEFMVSDNYPVFAGDVYLRWSALKKGSPFGDIVEGINPAQSTVASIAWDGMTKSMADTRAATCTGAISWDGGKKEPLMPQIPFQQ